MAINAATSRAYAATPGLEEAVEKEVTLASIFTAWGYLHRRVEGRAGAPRERRAGLACVLAVLVAKRVADRKTLERTVHAATHPLMHRGERLSFFRASLSIYASDALRSTLSHSR